VTKSPRPSSSDHSWTFRRLGGLDQATLSSAADLSALGELDQKLWVALSCPVKGLELDEKTLTLIDTDGDGRIRPPEVIAAAQWAATRLLDPAELLLGSGELPLARIAANRPEGAPLLAAAAQILSNLGKTGAASLSVSDFSDPASVFSAGRINGDGVIPVEAAADEETKALIADIAACGGLTPSRAGGPGITPAQAVAFFADLQAYADWTTQGSAPTIACLGEQTGSAYAAVAAIRAKVDDYFTRCRVAAFDPLAEGPLNPDAANYLKLGEDELSGKSAALIALPLARIAPGRALPLGGAVNPAWAGTLATLQGEVIAPLLGAGKSALAAEDWAVLIGRFATFEAWLAAKPAGKAAALPSDRVRAILLGQGRAGLQALIARDAALAPGFAASSDLERLVRYRRDLRALLNNFVNFTDFYSRDRMATFQAGTLYLDSRSCELCVRVEDPAAHAVLAVMSKACIAYVDCRRPGGAALKIAACFTQGDVDYLFVGRNGVFYDRHGQDWDATITKLIENPISIRQAFLSPYKKLVRFVEAQVAKHAAEADDASGAALASGATPGSPPKAKIDVGTVAALGVAVGGISTAFGLLLGSIVQLHGWKIPAVVAGITLVISGPSMLIAWLKLRQRTLGPLLEASGWAINGRVKINLPLGRVLSDLPTLPPHAARQLGDPYRDTAGFWKMLAFYAVLGALAAGLITARVKRAWPFEGVPAAAAAPAAAGK
jgi:hypothetical protein